MNREPLDIYDELPEDMKLYLKYNGRHFNKRLVEFAISKMVKKENGIVSRIQPIHKDELLTAFKQYGIEVECEDVYDMIYVANMCKADFLGSSIVDDEHLCRYVKDVVDDIDGYEGLVFNRWYADACRKGINIDWYEYR